MRRLVPLALVLLAGCAPNARISSDTAEVNARARLQKAMVAEDSVWRAHAALIDSVFSRPDTISLAIPEGEK